MARQKGFEPPTHGLEGRCSIRLSYWRLQNGAGEGDRTLATSLEGWGLPLSYTRVKVRYLVYPMIKILSTFFGKNHGLSTGFATHHKSFFVYSL